MKNSQNTAERSGFGCSGHGFHDNLSDRRWDSRYFKIFKNVIYRFPVPVHYSGGCHALPYTDIYTPNAVSTVAVGLCGSYAHGSGTAEITCRTDRLYRYQQCIPIQYLPIINHDRKFTASYIMSSLLQCGGWQRSIILLL